MFLAHLVGDLRQLFSVLQAPVFDSLAFDLLAFQQNDVARSEVDVSGREITQALVIAEVIVVLDKAPIRVSRSPGR